MSNSSTRAALYARVSTQEQVDGYSLDAQKHAFQNLIKERGWAAYREYVEEGRSAHSDSAAKRPAFQAAITDALDAEYDVLVVHKIDRFSRRLQVTLEYFEKLGKAGVGFISMQEEMDYTTPQGKLMLTLQGGLAEFYSANLSQEVKKGLGERKRQGLYCGSLPFGVAAGEDGAPAPHPETYAGLKEIFEQSAFGKTDREIAQLMNARGFKTAGSRGNRPFQTSSVRGILKNRFYLGFLPDGKGGWLNGMHDPLIDQDVWNRAQAARSRRRTSTESRTPAGKRISSLTGMTYCWSCHGRIHTQQIYKGEPRLGCYQRQQGSDCRHRSTPLSVYEKQIEAYLKTFHVPDDYQAIILENADRRSQNVEDSASRKANLERRLRRVRDLYELGDYERAEYISRRDKILGEIASLSPVTDRADHLERLAKFLADVSEGWSAASPEKRNKLARVLFDQVWLEDRSVVAVKPRPELESFFKINFDDFVRKNVEEPTRTRLELHFKTVLKRFDSEHRA